MAVFFSLKLLYTSPTQSSARPSKRLSPAARAVVDGWIARGADVHAHVVAGEPFWSTIEIAECPELVSETARVIAGVR